MEDGAVGLTVDDILLFDDVFAVVLQVGGVDRQAPGISLEVSSLPLHLLQHGGIVNFPWEGAWEEERELKG